MRRKKSRSEYECREAKFQRDLRQLEERRRAQGEEEEVVWPAEEVRAESGEEERSPPHSDQPHCRGRTRGTSNGAFQGQTAAETS